MHYYLLIIVLFSIQTNANLPLPHPIYECLLYARHYAVVFNLHNNPKRWRLKYPCFANETSKTQNLVNLSKITPSTLVLKLSILLIFLSPYTDQTLTPEPGSSLLPYPLMREPSCQTKASMHMLWPPRETGTHILLLVLFPIGANLLVPTLRPRHSLGVPRMYQQD